MGDSGKPTARPPSARPVPMKLFAAWEVDKTTPNCIPRHVGRGSSPWVFTLFLFLDLQPPPALVVFIQESPAAQRAYHNAARSRSIPDPRREERGRAP
ncbi:hypothetical protein HPB50_001285 [Hyalomma asiaticum]|uniref:Uncharacterized protein n=1 Tax=Hyalomma asiaticum TaxID=266040 RepID=A0ACB7RPU4_HYAAI|nr:hypothetical protein HPB50_001285 [Hyalomma asiaticum]